MEKITSRSNPLLIHLKKLGTSASYRREQNAFLCDSPKLLGEAIKWNADILDVVKTEGFSIPDVSCRKIVEVPEDVMVSISPLKTPQGVLFSCKMKEQVLPNVLDGRCFLVLDGVQDPGNVGTIIRSMDAFNGSGLFLLPGCADPYGMKTVRASMGALFRTNVWNVDLESLVDILKNNDIPLYGTTLREHTLDIHDLSLQKVAVAIGSEGQGLSEEVILHCEKTMKIPMSPRCESLNAAMAATVVLWESFK